MLSSISQTILFILQYKLCYKYDISNIFSLGFISAVITELWSNLECGRDDVRVTHPRATPVDPIDQSCQKVRRCATIMHTFEGCTERTPWKSDQCHS